MGVALGSVAYAFVDAAFGPLGLHFAVLWDLGNLLSGQPQTSLHEPQRPQHCCFPPTPTMKQQYTDRSCSHAAAAAGISR